MKVFRLLSVGVAAILLLGGCGGGGDRTVARNTAQGEEDLAGLQLSMEGYAAPPDSGILLGERLGYFADVGVNLTIVGAVRPEYAIGYAVDGASQVVICRWPEVVRAGAEGEPVVAVGSLLTVPAAAMIWLRDSKIGGIGDLKGKTIAVPGVPFQTEFLKYVLEGAGLSLADVKLKTVGFNSVQALADGRADAAFGASWNVDGAALESRGLDPVVTKVTDLGIPDYEELAVATNRRNYAKDPGLYRRVVRGISHGAVAVGEDPEAGAETVVDKTLELAAPKPTLAGVEATAPVLSKTGRIDRGKLKGLIDWMYAQGMIGRKIPVSKLIAVEAEETGKR
jgi:putative hydroxymethylpyrimidine transport system substrate-binding protein